MVKKGSWLSGTPFLKAAIFKTHGPLLAIQGHIIPQSYCAGSLPHLLNDFFSQRVSLSLLWLCMHLAPSGENLSNSDLGSGTSMPVKVLRIADISDYGAMGCQEETTGKR